MFNIFNTKQGKSSTTIGIMKDKGFTLADNKFNWFPDYCFVGILSTDDPDIPDPAPADISHLDLPNLTHRNKSASFTDHFEGYFLDYGTQINRHHYCGPIHNT